MRQVALERHREAEARRVQPTDNSPRLTHPWPTCQHQPLALHPRQLVELLSRDARRPPQVAGMGRRGAATACCAALGGSSHGGGAALGQCGCVAEVEVDQMVCWPHGA